ncbi:pyridoxal kinase PdxY [Ahrensia sp. 13_GOM-1096m]|uniref:pyridoxal kinase PdxY n=1 Tax=Ahrensia sp. 13_GOM-1096m TaxID=1380380 RepID=UPI000A67E16F|nr:pyridoxal kinase PdxY [Ahrensia sp. 13_GOM-1096m]
MRKPSVIVISSHVVRGSVGNRAAVFALETLGFPVWAVPTVTLPWHPGHGKATRIVPDDADFAALLDDLLNSKFVDEVGAVLTGYLGSAGQAESIGKFIASLRKKVPDLVYVCDPVIGDEGGLYIPEDTASTIRDALIPQADLITPNRFEFEWLSNTKFKDNNAIVEQVRKSDIPRAIITSAFGMLKGGIGNLFIDDNSAWLAEHRKLTNVPSGTGDLTAALVLARYLSGMSASDALHISTQSVFEVLSNTAKRGADELTLEQDMHSLRQPRSMVQMRAIGPSVVPKRSC